MPNTDIIRILKRILELDDGQGQVLQFVRNRRLNLEKALCLAINDAISNKAAENIHELNADISIIQILFAAGANPYRAYFGWTSCPALDLIISSDFLSSCSSSTLYFAQSFMSCGHHEFGIQRYSVMDYLRRAAERGQTNAVELILLCYPGLLDIRKNRDLHFYDEETRYISPLDLAVRNDRIDTSFILFAYEADLDSIHSSNIEKFVTVQTDNNEFEKAPVFSNTEAFNAASLPTQNAISSMNEPYNPPLNALLAERVQNFLLPCASLLSGCGILPPDAASQEIVEYFHTCGNTQELLQAFRHLSGVISMAIYHRNKEHRVSNTISNVLYRRGMPDELIQKANYFSLFSPVISAFSTCGIHGCINDLGAAMFIRFSMQERQQYRHSVPRRRVCSKCTIL